MKLSGKSLGTVLPGTRLIGGRPPAPGYLVATLVAGTAVLAHLEPLAPAALGTAALVVVFAPLWLSARATTAWLVVLGLSLLPAAAPTALQAGSTVATVVLLTLAGRHVAALGAEVGTAQASTLRQVTARDEEARASETRQAELARPWARCCTRCCCRPPRRSRHRAARMPWRCTCRACCRRCRAEGSGQSPRRMPTCSMPASR
jgi:hypothetical protein